MRITLTIVALVEIGAAAAWSLRGNWPAAVAFLLAAASIVGWALAETAAQAWQRKALRAQESAESSLTALATALDPEAAQAPHVHRASCHGPAGELQCGAWA